MIIGDYINITNDARDEYLEAEYSVLMYSTHYNCGSDAVTVLKDIAEGYDIIVKFMELAKQIAAPQGTFRDPKIIITKDDYDESPEYVDVHIDFCIDHNVYDYITSFTPPKFREARNDIVRLVNKIKYIYLTSYATVLIDKDNEN